MSFYAAPCKKCPDRRAGDKDHPPCHAECERYKAWRAYKDAEREARLRSAECPVQQYVNSGRRKAKKLAAWHDPGPRR